MKVEFSLRIPGQRETLPVVKMDCVPRVGELVALKGGATHEVHSVTHDIERGVVCILLRV